MWFYRAKTWHRNHDRKMFNLESNLRKTTEKILDQTQRTNKIKAKLLKSYELPWGFYFQIVKSKEKDKMKKKLKILLILLLIVF